jgi:hypothetical protein
MSARRTTNDEPSRRFLSLADRLSRAMSGNPPRGGSGPGGGEKEDLMDENDQTGQYLLDRATLECECWEDWERRPFCRRPQLPPMWGGGLCGLVAPADVTARARFER